MRQSTLRDYKQRLIRVLMHIQQNLDGTLDLEELAGLACFSPYHFHRVFKGMLGESLMGHIRRLRLERAAAQIKHGSLPITQIALNAGYETHEAFSRAFKAAFGVSPSQFRLDNRPAATKASSGVHYRSGVPLTDFRTIASGGQIMDVKVKTSNPMRVAFMRHVGPYSQCGTVWDRLCAFMGKEGLLGGDSLFIGVSYDDPDVTQPEKIRYDACVTVDERFAPTEEIGVQVISGGQFAVLTHFGSYDELAGSYARLFGEWLPRSGRELRSDPCFEIYFNDPESTEPDDLITDIYMPLEPR